MAMAYIKVYYDQLESLKPYGDAEVGRLIRGLLEYSMTGIEPDFKGNERFIWPTLRGAVDRDAEQYASKCAALRENGQKGGRKPKANGFSENQMVSEKANGFSENQMHPRQEKEKDNIPPISPSKGDERFGVFWKAYPRKVGKGAAEKAFKRLKVNDDLLSEMLEAIESSKRSYQWTRDGGQYIPHPTTWLNQKRWEDEAEPVPFEPEPAEENVAPNWFNGDWESMYG